jgi:hypothetical protein
VPTHHPPLALKLITILESGTKSLSIKPQGELSFRGTAPAPKWMLENNQRLFMLCSLAEETGK